MIGMLVSQLSLDIEAFILMNLMKDVELNDSGYWKNGDFLIIIDFHSMESFRKNRNHMFHFLKQDITKNYGDFIFGTFSVDYCRVNGKEVTLPQYVELSKSLQDTQLSRNEEPPHIEQLRNFLETLCTGDIFTLNDAEYGENFIDLLIQVDSYHHYLEHESQFINFINNLFQDYQYMKVSLVVGVYLIKGDSMDQISYLQKIGETLYSED